MGSFSNRFAINVVANILKSIQTFVAGLLIARGLGPDQYGKMVYLLGTFTAIRQLTDFGSSTTFFTLISKRRRDWRFVAIYLAWQLIQFVGTFVAIIFLLPKTLAEMIWRGENNGLILLAFMASYLQSSLWSTVIQIGEAMRVTWVVQLVGTIVGFVHCILMLILLTFNLISVSLVLKIIVCEWSFALCFMLYRVKLVSFECERSGNLKTIFDEFRLYCLPLVPYAWISFAYEMSDKWMLQTYGGNTQQAFYAVGNQFGSIAGVATASMLNVFWKEVAEAYDQGLVNRVNTLFVFVLKSLYLFASIVSGFLIPWAPNLLSLALGESFRSGSGVLIIMLLYPIHQSMGQVCGAMLYATGKTKISVVAGAISMILSILLTSFLLVPHFGISAIIGDTSVVIASKMVLLQIISVNIVSVYIVRSMNISYDWAAQLLPVLTCIILGRLSYMLFGCLNFSNDLAVANSIFPGIFVSGLVYLSLVVVITKRCPICAGFNRHEIDQMDSMMRKMLRF